METSSNNAAKRDDLKDDHLGENSGQTLAKGNQPNEQNKHDDERVKTVTPDNDSGDPGPPVEERSSNKHQGPKGENL